MSIPRHLPVIMRRHPFVTGTVLALAALAAVLLATGTVRGIGSTAKARDGAPRVASRPAVQLGAPGRSYWGADISLPNGQAPWDMSVVAQFERDAGKRLSLISWGSPWYSGSHCGGFCGFSTTLFNDVRQHGAIPFFSWAPDSLPSIDAKIARGAYDAYVTTWAKQAKKWGHPFFLRFAWEMNGSWFGWGIGNQNHNTPADFVAMWRHVHDIFEKVGAKNVTWVWCPNVNAPTTFKPISQLYPGNDVVNWTCLDGYNGNNPWLSFSALYSGSYNQITGTIAPDKPMILGEVASTETGGSKSRWITDMFSSLPALFPRIRGVVWANDRSVGPGGNSDWLIESSPAAASAFAASIASPTFTPNDFSHLSSDAIMPPS
jgi:mannan endo-1,4-beta-mannosidase